MCVGEGVRQLCQDVEVGDVVQVVDADKFQCVCFSDMRSTAHPGWWQGGLMS